MEEKEVLTAGQADAFLSGWEGQTEAPAPSEVPEAPETPVSDAEAPQPQPDTEQEPPAAQTGDAQHRDIGEFAATFPEVYQRAKVDKSAIPDGVWKDVAGGIPLAAAYAKNTVIQAAQAVKEAKEAARAAEERARVAQQNQRNSQRATGSMRSAGGDIKNKDPFLEGWEA